MPEDELLPDSPMPTPAEDGARTLEVLERVCAVQEAILQTETPDAALFMALLDHFVEFSGSAYGFLGEVFYDDGAPWLQSRAMSNIAWNDETRRAYADAVAAAGGLAFRNLNTLFGQCLRTGELTISNAPTTDPRAGGLPQGHPALNSFVGIPVRLGGQFIGMVGLANRPGGYHPDIVRTLSPLTGAAASLLYMLRVHRARAAAEAAVARRVTFERLILEISTHFIHADAGDFDAVVDSALARVGTFVEADRSYLFLFSDDDTVASNTHEWCAEGISPEKDNLQAVPVEAMDFAFAPMREGRALVVPDVQAIPPEGAAVREALEPQGIKSAVLVPINHEGRLQGFVGFDAVRAHRAWSNDDAALLQVLAEDIGHLIRRNRAARRLAESERRFRLIASHVRQAFFLVTRDYSQMLYVSPAFEDIWGIPCAQVIADPLSWLESLHPDDRPVVAGTIPTAGDQETTTEYRIRRPDGTLRWVRVQTLPVRSENGGPVEQIAGIAEDVTDQHTAAEMLARHNEWLEAAVEQRTEALTRSTSALRTVADAMPVAVLMLEEAEVRFANPSAEQLFGLTSGGTLNAAHQAVADAARVDEGHREIEVVRPDGLPREIRVLARAVDFEGRPCRLLAALDVTEQRRAERMLREQQNTIARLAYVGNMEGLASAVAHELNQPLSAIVMWIGGLHAKLARGPVPHDDLVSVLDRLRTQSLRAGELMRRLRSFSTRGDVQRHRLDLDDVCQQALRQLDEVAATRGVTLEVALAAEGTRVIGDAVQLEVVVTNLLRNAIDAVEDQPRGLPAARRVSLSTEKTPGGVRLCVRDTGPGVPVSLRATIFEPLVSTKPNGMGIGLSIARSIVEAHRGYLALLEADEGGAVFEITLPEGVGGGDD